MQTVCQHSNCQHAKTGDATLQELSDVALKQGAISQPGNSLRQAFMKKSQARFQDFQNDVAVHRE